MKPLHSLSFAVLTACVGSVPGEGGRPDAGGGAADAGPHADAGADSPALDAQVPTIDAAPGIELLADEMGCFYTAPPSGAGWERVIGDAGTSYRTLAIRYRVIHGGWREALFDRPVLNHNLMGLRRNVPEFVGRYILGNAAQMKPAIAGHDRRSLMYGRVDLEPRPPGEGYTGYTSWRTPFAWREGETYRVEIILDAVAHEQRLSVTASDDTGATTVGDIDYFEPSLSAATYTIELGGNDSEEREVRAVGWTFCDLRVEAIRE